MNISSRFLKKTRHNKQIDDTRQLSSQDMEEDSKWFRASYVLGLFKTKTRHDVPSRLEKRLVVLSIPCSPENLNIQNRSVNVLSLLCIIYFNEFYNIKFIL